MRDREAVPANAGQQGTNKTAGLIATLASGASLIVPILRKRSLLWWMAAAAGGALIFNGIKASRAKGGPSIEYLQQCVTIRRSPSDLSSMWRDPRVLDRVVRPFGSVVPDGEGHLRWTVDIPIHGTFAGEAFKVEERLGRFVHWRTVPGSPVEVDEWLLLDPNAQGTSVTLRYRVDYSRLPAGSLAGALTTFFKRAPQAAIRKVLHNLKEYAESQAAGASISTGTAARA